MLLPLLLDGFKILTGKLGSELAIQ